MMPIFSRRWALFFCPPIYRLSIYQCRAVCRPGQSMPAFLLINQYTVIPVPIRIIAFYCFAYNSPSTEQEVAFSYLAYLGRKPRGCKPHGGENSFLRIRISYDIRTRPPCTITIPLLLVSGIAGLPFSLVLFARAIRARLV